MAPACCCPRRTSQSWWRPITIIAWFWAVLLCMDRCCTAAADVEESFNAESWLRQFGYLSQASRQMSTMQSAQILSKAVTDMQRFYGLEVTGEMNADTLSAMRRPRCGLPDRKADETEGGARRRRYALTGQQWDKDHLTYSIITQQFPSSLSEERVLSALRRAFDVWRRVTPLTFQEMPAENNYNNVINNNNNNSSTGGGSQGAPLADILMLFASGFHGDMSLFDGEGGSLAHAYYPGPGTGGDVHFDADEPWTLDNQDPKGIDVFLVAVHELGHALGLEHSDDPGAIMAPFYQWMDTHNFTLPQDDVRGIQYIYGSPLPTDTPPTSAPTPAPDGDPPTSPPPPERDPHETPHAPPPDDDDDNPPDDDTPRPTTALDLPEDPGEEDPSRPSALPPTPPAPTDPQPDPEPVTPTVRRPAPPPRPPYAPPPPPRHPPKQPDHRAPPDICDGDFDTVTVLRGEMFVFKGGWFWRVRRNRVLDNYPMPISVFWIGLPSDIDAAYERHDGKFVFFKDDRYWVFREADVVPGYPQPLEEYGQGVPADRIDTAIWWEPNGFTYFFRGDRYWRYNEETRSTDSDFPKPISRWGRIPSSPNGAFLSDDGAYTYFYKGSNYWRFDNSRTKADAGYPRSILKDFMGCQGVRDPQPDPDDDPDTTNTDEADRDRRPPVAVPPSGRDPDRPRTPDDDDDYNNHVPDEDHKDTAEEEEDDEVNVVVRVAPENDSKVMTLVMVTAPLVLILCILVLIYAILRTLNKKETPRALVHCKRSLQDWV